MAAPFLFLLWNLLGSYRCRCRVDGQPLRIVSSRDASFHLALQIGDQSSGGLRRTTKGSPRLRQSTDKGRGRSKKAPQTHDQRSSRSGVTALPQRMAPTAKRLRRRPSPNRRLFFSSVFLPAQSALVLRYHLTDRRWRAVQL